MADERPVTKAQLLQETNQAWSELNTALDNLTDAQMTDIRDPQGWAVKDHLTHLAAWERSMVFLFEGRPRHEGLGVDEQVYREGGDDGINAAIQARDNDLTAAEARSQLRDVHAQLMQIVEPMSDEDLMKPYSHFLPGEPGRDDSSPIFFRVHGNTAGHFEEHLGWIKELAGGLAR
jgi:hypothetical protein